jgi:serine/threonine protein kinase/Tol biopolymer transport system component
VEYTLSATWDDKLTTGLMSNEKNRNTELDYVDSETIAPSGAERKQEIETLGPYTISRVLGQGAMGIVYEAIDSTLDRTVAIKTLPAELASDRDRIARFKREATLLASFSHPHIATVYSHEELDDQHCLVMEYVEGQGLDNLIADSKLTLSEILQIALQVSSALEVAHNHGVVHRDLKPANICLTSSFKVKVLDFGLAKNTRIGGSSSSVDQVVETAAGQVIGTPSYMSPEQARGRTVDKRADLWAVGCILFEMLAGERVFGGDNISDTLVGILQEEPNWSLLPDDTPATLVKIIERCLQKDVDTRLPDAGVIRIELEELTGGKSSILSTSAIGPTVFKKPKQHQLILFTVAIIAALVGWFAGILFQENDIAEYGESAEIRSKPFYSAVELQSPINLELESLAHFQTTFAISPDGRTIAYSTGLRRDPLIIRNLGGYSDIVVDGSNGAHSPFFSPDNKQIAFVLDEKLCVVSSAGGTVKTLADAEVGSAGAWQSDGYIYFPTTESSALWRIRESGGEREKLYDTYWGGCENPTALPDGRLLFTTKKNSIHDDYSEAMIFDPEDRSLTSLGVVGMHVEYCDLGYLVYCRGGALFAKPFDIASDSLLGDEIPIASRVASNAYLGNAHFDVSDSGTVIFLNGRQLEQGFLAIMDSEGKLKKPLENCPTAGFGRFVLSPDERYLAFTIVAESDDVWIYDLAEKTLRKVTNEGANIEPTWAPDGQAIYYASKKDGQTNLYKMSMFGGEREKLAGFDEWFIRVTFGATPDVMLLESNIGIADVSGVADLGAVSVENEDVNWGPAVSPNDKWVAFVSDRTGRYEIFLASMPFDAANARQVSFDGGYFPMWSKDGKKMFFEYYNKFYEVNVGDDLEGSLPAPVEVFEHNWVGVPGRNYVLYGDDGGFIAVQPSESDEPTDTMKIIQNALPSRN